MRLLLAVGEEEYQTVYTGGFLASDTLEDDETHQREAVIHGEGEYVDGDAHVNTRESYAPLARQWLSLYRGISKDTLTPYLRAF